MTADHSPSPIEQVIDQRIGPWLLLLIGALVGALMLLVLGPRPAALGTPTGDAVLARDATAALAPGTDFSAISVVRIRDGQPAWAGFGDVGPDSRFEIGSLTKTFNGLLLADAAERGEVRLDDRLETHLAELAGTAAGSVTLEELAQHTSGLPNMAPMSTLRIIAEDLAGASYSAFGDATPQGIIEASKTIPLTSRGSWSYSNLGAALLGFALARAAGDPDWTTYVTQRLFTPLDMTETLVAATGAPAGDLLQPHNPNGNPMAPQTGTGYAPAGIGVTSTSTDLTKYAQALLSGTAPGMAALGPRIRIDSGALAGQQMGLAWVVSDADGHDVTWHNGMPGGMTSMLVVDRQAQAGVIVLGNRARDLTGAGLILLAGTDDPGIPAPPPVDGDTVAWVAVGIPLVLLFAFGAVRGRSRSRVLGQGLGAAGAVLLWGIAQPWDWAPPWTFGVALGVGVAGGVIAAMRWHRLPWLPPRRRAPAIIAFVLGVAWFCLMVGFAVYVGTLIPRTPAG